METSYLKVIKKLSPGFGYPNFNEFINNLNANDMEWFASFRINITDKLELELYEEVFGEGVKSLLPVRTLIAMMIMKQGLGWSDLQLIQECQQDTSVRHALGIHVDDQVPSVPMLNKFRMVLDQYNETRGLDLFNITVEELTAMDGPVVKLGEGKIMLQAMRVA